VKPYFIELQFSSRINTSQVAQDIVRSIGRWYLAGPVELDEERRAKMGELVAASALANPPEGRFASYKIPLSHFTSESTTPTALLAKASGNAVKKALMKAQVARQLEKATAFREHSAEGLPPSDFFDVPPLGSKRYESPLGVLVESTKRLWTRPSETLQFHGWGQLRGFVLVDPIKGIPDKDNGTFIPLCQGIGQLLLTNKNIFIAITKGSSAGGRLSPDGRAMMVASMPLAEVAHIEMSEVTNVPGHVGPDLVIRPKNKMWGEIWVSSVGAELKLRDGQWIAERGEGDLEEIMDRLSSICRQDVLNA